MKTQKECHQALCEGKTLIRHTGEKVRYNDLGFLCGQRSADEPWRQYNYTFDTPENWQIYKEPSASYEEAVAAKRVLIYFPGLDVAEHFKRGAWHLHSLMAFDLAARRGYRMEVVE